MTMDLALAIYGAVVSLGTGVCLWVIFFMPPAAREYRRERRAWRRHRRLRADGLRRRGA